VRVDVGAFGGSALTGELAVPKGRRDLGEGIPVTYVPARNTVFLSMALAWAETYMELRPRVRISVTGGGSGTGIAAMINGTVDIANASRKMKAEISGGLNCCPPSCIRTSVPISRLIERTVSSGAKIYWLRAGVPTSHWPAGE